MGSLKDVVGGIEGFRGTRVEEEEEYRESKLFHIGGSNLITLTGRANTEPNVAILSARPLGERVRGESAPVLPAHSVLSQFVNYVDDESWVKNGDGEDS